jgi:hypothetical protein
MKATLQFDLDKADDQMAHLRCIKATDMAIVLHYIVNNLQRSMNQSYDSGYSEKPEMEDVFKEINEQLIAYDINICSLIL